MKAWGGAEVFEDTLFARRPDAGYLVEDGAGHGVAPQLLLYVLAKRWASSRTRWRRCAVRGSRGAGSQSSGPVRLEKLFVALASERKGCPPARRPPKLLKDRTLADAVPCRPVKQDQVRLRLELLVALAQAL